MSGKIVAILDPVASSDPSSGELVLSALQQQEVVVLGALRHMSACAGLKKDGSRCSMIADKCISEYCMYHRHSSKTVQPACNISQQARTPITAPTAPRAPVVTAKKMASEQAADLLDALLHAPQRVKAAVQTAGRAADLFR